jgi:hypothetical protein
MELSCAVCFITSGGGTTTPAVTVVNGQAMCDRHLEDALDFLRPEVTPTS